MASVQCKASKTKAGIQVEFSANTEDPKLLNKMFKSFGNFLGDDIDLDDEFELRHMLPRHLRKKKDFAKRLAMKSELYTTTLYLDYYLKVTETYSADGVLKDYNLTENSRKDFKVKLSRMEFEKPEFSMVYLKGKVSDNLKEEIQKVINEIFADIPVEFEVGAEMYDLTKITVFIMGDAGESTGISGGGWF